MKNKENKVYLEADIKLERETAELREAASSIIELPKDGEKQPDLLYFSAIFVSSGENLNHAYFLPSELVKAEGTIVNKALDVEHKEENIIGHIYDREFMTVEGEKVDVVELAAIEESSLDKKDFHVAIAGIVYKNRFPNVAEEIAKGKWKVSMEAFYTDYDIKVGDLIISRKEAETLGLTSDLADVFGKIVKVIKKGKELAEGHLTRVLRGVVFSGCGIVKTPANPPSVILETAKEINKEENDKHEEPIVLDYDKLEQSNNKVTSKGIESDEKDDEETEKAENMEYDDTVGICVSYKKRILDATFEGPNVKVLHEDWCTLFNESCSSFSRDTTDSACLRNVKNAEIKAMVKASVKKLAEKKELDDQRSNLLDNLINVLGNAEKLS